MTCGGKPDRAGRKTGAGKSLCAVKHEKLLAKGIFAVGLYPL